VLEKAQSELLNYDNTGMSVMELSHRGKTFAKILAEAKANLTTLLNIPDNYEILFMQGGGTTQFSAVVYNLLTTASLDLGHKRLPKKLNDWAPTSILSSIARNPLDHTPPFHQSQNGS
jgi:phosphoserine aminotransferase